MNWFIIQWWVMIFLIFLSAFFSSSEVAYTGLSLSQLKRINRIRPTALDLWEKSPDRVLAALLLSNNAVNAGVGVLAASLAFDLSKRHDWPQSVSTLGVGFICSILVLLFGEIFPKVWAKQYPVSWALRVTPILRVWIRLVGPFANTAVGLTNKILSRQPVKRRRDIFLKETELNQILRHSAIPSGSKKILHNVIDFSQSKVEDVMTHRSDIFAIALELPIEKILESVIQSGFSRVPVYAGSLDNIKGILYSKDLLVAWRSGKLIVLEDLLRPVRRVESDMPLPDLLRLLRTGRQHLALVNQKGNPDRLKGLVTIQDALEAIFGEIREEL